MEAVWVDASEWKYQLSGFFSNFFLILHIGNIYTSVKNFFYSLLLAECRVSYQKNSLEDKMQYSTGGKFNTWNASLYLRENLCSGFRETRDKLTSWMLVVRVERTSVLKMSCDRGGGDNSLQMIESCRRSSKEDCLWCRNLLTLTLKWSPCRGDIKSLWDTSLHFQDRFTRAWAAVFQPPSDTLLLQPASIFNAGHIVMERGETARFCRTAPVQRYFIRTPGTVPLRPDGGT